MQYQHVKKAMIKSGLFLVLCLIAFMGTAKAGLDYYEIYLGKKLIFKRYLDKPLRLENLPLSDANVNDQLVIHYYQCNAPGRSGTKRVIALKDTEGKTIKEWKFADAQGSNNGMSIPVKELVQWQKKSKSQSLSLIYTAQGRTEGEKLVYLPAGTKAVSYIDGKYLKPSQKDVAGLPYLHISNYL